MARTFYNKQLAVWAKRREKAIRDVERGHTIQSIANKLGVSRQAVSKWVNRKAGA